MDMILSDYGINNALGELFMGLKKCLITALCFFLIPLSAPAADNEAIISEIDIQSHIDNIGFEILNSNKINKRIVFAYSKKDKKYKGRPEITKRQIMVYGDQIKYTETDDEMAALLAMKISDALKSYEDEGFMGAIEVKIAPKKYEKFSDKRAVDYMVNAGYNPLGLITLVQKSCPQRRNDWLSAHNLTSKRLAEVYEYIFIKYPYFLENNEYIENPYYQNFLLSSIENRKIFERKLKYKTVYKVKYE